MSRLSVCLLTRDEERNIERAVRSVAGLADEVLVADTGSTDRTIEIARGLGAEVFPFAWDDDFSAGRNDVLGRASGDWVLWLNPDEELLPASRRQVRELIDSAGADVFGYLARVRERPEGRTARPVQRDPGPPALSAIGPTLRYVGRLHPGFPADLARGRRRRRGNRSVDFGDHDPPPRLHVDRHRAEDPMGRPASGEGAARPPRPAPLPDRVRPQPPDAQRPEGPRGHGRGGRAGPARPRTPPRPRAPTCRSCWNTP